jgi:hypothetical protein
MKLLGIISVDFDVMDHLLIRFYTFVRYLTKKMGVQWDSASTIYRIQESL